jgi:hypothetical protein
MKQLVMNFNTEIMNWFSKVARMSTFAILLIAICHIGNAQNLKKVFKYIESNEVNKANLELIQFTDKDKASPEDRELFDLASCLTVCNENCQNYDPYKALEMFEMTSNNEADLTLVNEFLAKYGLSIIKVQETICSSILNQAKKINTEASYQKAIYVSDKCGFKSEVAELLVNAAYNEAKGKNSLEGYYRFVSIYSDSKYIIEIQGIIHELEFYKAKSVLSLKSMNDYIEKYSGSENKFIPVAIHVRDSIVYSKLNKTYPEYVDFMKKYPNSEYNSQIKKELPDLLYTLALKTNDIGNWELFVNEYPDNSHIAMAKSQLEELYYKRLLSGATILEFKNFKDKFPESKYIDSCLIYSKILALSSDSTAKKKFINNQNNDYQFPLKGAVKTVFETWSIIGEGNSQGKGIFNAFILNFDKSGLITEFVLFENKSLKPLLYKENDTVKYDEANIKKLAYSKDFNSLVVSEFEGKGYSIHNMNGNLKEIKTTDINKNGELFGTISIDELGNVIEYLSYANRTDFYKRTHTNKYNTQGNQMVSYIKGGSHGYGDSVIVKYNDFGQLVNRESFSSNSSIPLSNISYKYDNFNNIIEVLGDYHIGGDIRNKFDNNHNIIETGRILENGEYKLIINREYDEKGNFIQYKLCKDDGYLLNLERALRITNVQEGYLSDEFSLTGLIFKYVYDNFGNWVTKYMFYEDDINEPYAKFERKIVYY